MSLENTEASITCGRVKMPPRSLALAAGAISIVIVIIIIIVISIALLVFFDFIYEVILLTI